MGKNELHKQSLAAFHYLVPLFRKVAVLWCHQEQWRNIGVLVSGQSAADRRNLKFKFGVGSSVGDELGDVMRDDVER